MRISGIFIWLVLFILSASGLTHLEAQAVSGTILGTVTDSTGASIPNAQVTILLEGQSVAHASVTNESGNFTEPDLPSGNYTVTVVAAGFKTELRENIVLLTNTTQRVDLALTPGNVSETMTVTTAPPLLQTDRADISTNIESRQIATLPLSSGNSFQSLLGTIPGSAPVVFNNSQFFNANNDLSVNSNGQSSYVNLYQIEGIDDDQRTGIHIILVPPAASIANVDITTNNFEAEFGRAVGAVVNVTLKSGSNAFHGSVFQNMENNGVNARPYFANGPNGRLVYNYTGASIGGPILKDKFFFFGDFLRVSDHESSTITTTIPYYNVVNGNIDLSLYKGQVYDPKSGTPFADNQIPLTRATTAGGNDTNVGLKVLQAIDALARNPAKNNSSAAYLAGATTNNYQENTPFSKDSWSYDIKSEYILGKDHLSGRFSHQSTDTFQAPLFGPFLGGPASGGFEASGTATAYSTGFNYDHIFSPRLFTEARIGLAHLRNAAKQSDYGSADATTLGVPGTNTSDINSGQVAFQVNNFAGGNPLIGYSVSLPWLRAESNIDFANNWTRIIGNHALKAGVDIRRIRDDLLQGNINAAAGSYYFSENQTSIAGAATFNGTATGTANDIASVLLDVPYQVGQDTNSTFPAYRQTWLFFFISDKWQASPKLTIDYGVRYELYPAATPRKAGGFSSYQPSSNTLVIAGIHGNPLNIGLQTDYRNVAPRLGLSYRASSSTVVRAGYGISYVPFVDNSYAYNYPIKTSTDYNNAETHGPAVIGSGSTTPVNLATGLPPTPAPPISSTGTINATGNRFINSLGNLYIPLNFRNAYVSSWNAVVQQALPFNSSLQIAYVANHGTRIDVAQNINLPKIYGESPAYDPQNNAVVNGVLTPTFGKTASVTQYFLGYSTNYQSMQVQLSRRFAKSLGLTTAFTWAKAENYQTGAQDGGLLFFAGPVHRNYAVADFDRKLNYAQTVTYELPAGRGHNYFDHGVTQYILGGWTTSAIISAVSGLPFTLTTTSATTGTSQTVNEIGTYQVTHVRSRAADTPWFNPASFSNSASSFTTPGLATCPKTFTSACALGNTGRNQFRGPADFSSSLSLFKSFPMYRESNLQARFDAFNLTNTPQFSNPGTTYGSSSFGVLTSILSSGVGNVNGVGGPRVLQASVKFSF